MLVKVDKSELGGLVHSLFLGREKSPHSRKQIQNWEFGEAGCQIKRELSDIEQGYVESSQVKSSDVKEEQFQCGKR